MKWEIDEDFIGKGGIGKDMIWGGQWVGGFYPPNHVVVDPPWTMISNKPTSDRPAPVPSGSPFYYYDGTLSTSNVTAKYVWFGNRYEFDLGAYLEGVRVNLVEGNKYEIYLITDPLNDAGFELLYTTTADSTDWLEIPITPRVIPVGTTLDVVAHVSSPDSTPTLFSLDYDYVTPDVFTAPASGQLVHPTDTVDTLYIHKTSQSGTLSPLSVGDKINGAGKQWTIQSVTDSGAWVTLGIAPGAQGTPEGVQDFTFETVDASPIPVASDVDHWLGDGRVSGLYIADGNYGDIISDDTARGVDLRLDTAIISPDWDVIAFGGSGGSGGGGVTQHEQLEDILGGDTINGHWHLTQNEYLNLPYLDEDNDFIGSNSFKSNSAYPLFIGKTIDTGGSGIQFSDKSNATENGFLTYYHADAECYGSGNAFVFSGDQPSMSLVFDVGSNLNGAQVKTGTTLHDVWHAGNFGKSNIDAMGIDAATADYANDADRLDGRNLADSNQASTVVGRNGSGDIQCRLLRSEYANQTTINGALAFRTNNTTDNYTRYCSDPSAVRGWLDSPSTTGSGASGTWGISVSGGAGKVNLVSMSGLESETTTAQFLARLGSRLTTSGYTISKSSWSYAGHGSVTDTGCGTIDLAGVTIEVVSDGSTYMVRVTAAPAATQGLPKATWEYRDHGPTYSPGWTRNYNTANPQTSITGNAATATWADTVDVNTSTSTSWYGALWNSGDTIYTTTDVRIRPSDGSMTIKKLYINDSDGSGGYFFEDSTNRVAYTGGDFYIQTGVANTYLFATNTYLGDATGSTIRYRGSTITANAWGWNPNGQLTLKKPQSTSKSFSGAALKLLPSATTDTTGRTSIALSTSTVDNYGWTLNGWRNSTGGDGVFSIDRHSNSDTTGTSILTASSSGVVITGSLVVDTVSCKSGTQLVLNAGESKDYATGQAAEQVYVNAENGLSVTSSPDNWASGWAGRKTAIICAANGSSTFPGTVTAPTFSGSLSGNASTATKSTSTHEADYGIHGGYGNSNGSGGAWGANIWSMGTGYDGGHAGTSYTKGTYCLMWLRSGLTAQGYNSSAGEGIYVASQNAVRGAIGHTGIWSTGNITAYSDKRVKTNIEKIDNALDKIDKINGYTFDRVDIDVPRQAGVIAQELLEVLPEVVTGTEEDHYAVAYGNITALLIEGTKELKAQLEKERKRNDDLEARLAKLEAKFN